MAAHEVVVTDRADEVGGGVDDLLEEVEGGVVLVADAGGQLGRVRVEADAEQGAVLRGGGALVRENLQQDILRHADIALGMARDIDMAYSEDTRIDHSFVTPLSLITPSYDVPIVPIAINCNRPPLVSLARSHEAGVKLGAGGNYPSPIVDHAAARAEYLALGERMKASR